MERIIVCLFVIQPTAKSLILQMREPCRLLVIWLLEERFIHPTSAESKQTNIFITMVPQGQAETSYAQTQVVGPQDLTILQKCSHQAKCLILEMLWSSLQQMNMLNVQQRKTNVLLPESFPHAQDSWPVKTHQALIQLRLRDAFQQT